MQTSNNLHTKFNNFKNLKSSSSHMNIKSPLKRYSVFGLSNRWRQRIPQFTD